MAVFERGGRWVARIYDPETQGQKWVGSYETEAEAEAAEREALEERERRNRAMEGDETVASFVARYTRDYSAGRKASTIKHVNWQLKAFSREFGYRLLRDVTRHEARLWALGGYAPPKLRKVAAQWADSEWHVVDGKREVVVKPHKHGAKVARAMYSDAIAEGLSDKNPFSHISLPDGPGRKFNEPLTRKDLERLVELAEREYGEWGENVYGPMILFAAYTGMRPGEIFGIRWQDIDIDARRVHVRRQFNSTVNEYTTPKNGRERTILLPRPAAEALKRVPRSLSDDLVFHTSQRNARFTMRLSQYYWPRIRAAFGRPKMDFYDLRHFCGSYMADLAAERGIDSGAIARDIAHQLGHTDGGELARKLYIHTYEENALDRLDALWDEEPEVEAKPRRRRAAG